MMASYSGNYDTVLIDLAVGDIDHARLLLAKGTPLNLQRAAQVVISSGQLEALKFLISEYKLDVDKYCCLHLALLADQDDIAKWLVDSGADVNKLWNVESEKDIDLPSKKYVKVISGTCSGQSKIIAHYPLGLALHCSIDMMRFLLQSGADVNKGTQMPMYSMPVLHMAVITGNVEKTKLLIDHAADIEARTIEYETTLYHAADIEARTSEYANETTLMYARDIPSPDCVYGLLEKGTNPSSMTDDGFIISQATIHFATESGNIEILQLLIQHGAQLETRTSDGNTALLLACKKSVPADCVRILLEHGAFPNVKNRNQQMPLTLATDRNDEEKIRLLKQHGATEEERSDQEQTDLMSVCKRNGDVETVRHFLENNALPNLKNRRGETALHYAVLAGDVQKLKLLVQYNSDVNSTNDNGVTPLMRACGIFPPSVECVRFLLGNNALLNLTDIKGETAVHYAARARHLDIMQLLVQHGADLNTAEAAGGRPLIWACAQISVNVDYERFLLEHKASVNLKDFLGSTALGYAIRRKHFQKVKMLIEYNADVNVIMDDEKKELIKACFSRVVDREWVKFVIENSALPKLADIRGYTCLHWAVEFGDEEMIDLLLQNQANVNAMTDRGETPLMLACRRDFIDAQCVQSLLEKGALPNLTDEDHKTAFDFAVNTKCVKKIILLIDYGAHLKYNKNYLSAAHEKDGQFRKLFYTLRADIFATDSYGQNTIMLVVKLCELGGSTVVEWLVDGGVSVNQRDKGGWTPLMTAAYYGKTEIVRLLVEAGADLHAIRRARRERCVKETTALSMIFDHHSKSNYYCAELLIRLGAVNSLSKKDNDLLHLMVTGGNCRMVGLLLTHGMAPTLCSMSYNDADTLDPVSPLTLAIGCEKFSVIRYLTYNTALCPCDVNGHLYHTRFRALLSSKGRSDIITFMDEFFSQPKSLLQLCCVTISYTIGGVPGRLDRINSLPLPEPLKKQLSFKNTYIPHGYMTSQFWHRGLASRLIGRSRW